MLKSNSYRSALLACAAVAMLGACSGSDGVASPGVGAFAPAPAAPAPVAPAPVTPSPVTPTPASGPAADCPTGFSNVGTISNRRICQLPTTITGNLIVPNRAGTIYSVSGRTTVGTDRGADPLNPIAGSEQGILTIEPGVTIFGNSGLDYLLVQRGSQIFAEGTPTAPIIMTSRQSVEGTTNENSIGQWGGFVINGRAPTGDGCPSGVTAPNIQCQLVVEGSNATYGGNSPGDNSGRIRYLRVQHSGFIIGNNNELNGITFAGVGSATTAEFIQVHNSSDDGIEIFGGNLNLRRLVLTGNDDDSFDTDTGWSGAAQFGIIYQRPGGGNNGFEISSLRSTPTFFSRPTYANWTIVMRSTASGSNFGILNNQGHVARVFNSVITSAETVANRECLRIADAITLSNPNAIGAGAAANGSLFNSVFFSCAGGSTSGASPITAADVTAQVGRGAGNVLNGVSTLTGGFINGANENAVSPTSFGTNTTGNPLNANLNPVVGTNSNITSFLTPTTWIGAVQGPTDTWYAGWSCGLPGQPAC